jgi:hypothetical protein
MAMTARARELDTVELVEAIDGWPAGTFAVVVAEELRTALVEVVTEYLVDSDGFPLRDIFEDLVSVPYDQLRVVEAFAPGRS